MSLINDALRRANQQKKGQSPAGLDESPMQPVHPRRAQSDPSSYGLIVIIFIAVLLLVAGWFFWKSAQISRQINANAPSPVAVANLPLGSAPDLPPNNAPVLQETPPSIQVKSSTVLGEAVSQKTSDASVVPDPGANTISSTNQQIAPVVPAPAPLRLQGIFYRVSRPTALINGKTVAVGDSVAGARVLKIDRQEVTLQRDGRTNVLTME